MYSTTSDILNALKAPAREVSGGVYIYNDIGSSVSDYFLPGEDLIDFTIERTAPMGKFFGFIVSQKLTVKLIGSHSLPKGRKLQPYYEVAGGSIGIQYFYVDEVTIDEVANTTTIVAYDIFQKATEKTIDEVAITFPITLQAYTEAVAAALGTSLQGSIGYINPTLNVVNINGDETLKSILIAIAEATGTICYVHSGDKLKFRRLGSETAADTLDGSQYFEFATKDDITLTQVASTTQLGENISYGEEGYTQAIWDNPFLELYEDLETHLETLGTEMIGTVMTPYNIIWRGNPYYEIGDYIEVKTAKSEESKFIYFLNETFTYGGGYKSVLEWESEESEDIHSTPTSISKVLNQTYAKVDKVNNEIEIVAATANQASTKAEQAAAQVGQATEAANQATAKAKENTEAISSLRLTTDAISMSVQEVRANTTALGEEIDEDIASLTQKVDAMITSDSVQLQIQEAMKTGTSAVTTTTGFTFNEEGMNISKTGSEMSTQITEDGMTVSRNETEVLVCDNAGVSARNLHASTYLTVGGRSRFENYEANRTGCFWVGGND